MSEYYIWVCVFLFTVLDAAVKSQVSLRDKTQAFFHPNNNARYVVGPISVASQTEAAAEPVRLKTDDGSQNSNQVDGDEDSRQIKFSPPSLDFTTCTFGSARSEKVLVQNTNREKSVHLFSISGTGAHVHSSFFEDKVLPPLQNTSFQIIFLVRELGPFSSPLYIYTSEGTHKFMVEGIGVESPYRLQPIVFKGLPLNSLLRQQISIHNPYPTSITVLELVKNIEDLRLDLPVGRGQASQTLWKIPPYSTKTIMNAHFKAATTSNYTGYIRIKTSPEDTFFIPVDISVTATPGLYYHQDKFDFGYGNSLQEPSTFDLEVLNSARRVIKVNKVDVEPSTEAIRVAFEPLKVPANNTHPTLIATITVNWYKACEENMKSGKIVLRSKGGQQLLKIPFIIHPQSGALAYDKIITTFWAGNEARNAILIDFWVRNDYMNPLAVSKVELQPLSPKQKMKALKLDPTVLYPGEKLTLMKLGKSSAVKGMAFLVVYTNITNTNITLNSYDGRLHPIMLSLRPDEDLDLGLVGHGCVKEGFFALLNLNPLPIEINEWKISYSKAELELLGIDKEKFSTTNLLARTSVTDFDRSNMRIVEAGSYAVFRLRVEAPKHNENILEKITVLTDYEDIVIPFGMTVLGGSIEMVKDSLILPDCFPGKHCFATVQVQSTFPALMLVESVVSVPHSSDLRFYFPQLKQNTAKSIINPSTTSSIGHLLWGGRDAPEDLIYVDGYNDPAHTPCMLMLGLPPRTIDVDIKAFERNWNRFRRLTQSGKEQWKNYTFLMDTSGVRNFPFEVKVRLIWPRLTNITDQIVKFPLTQVGNTSFSTIEIINSASTALLLHLVLENDYPRSKDLLSTLPPKLIPTCSECTGRGRKNFGLRAHGVTSSHESSLLREAGVHPKTLLLLLAPLQSSIVFITFNPSDTGISSSALVIRNSLTVLEVLMLKGKATRPQFRFGNRQPGSNIPLTFDVPEKLLQECDRVRNQPMITRTSKAKELLKKSLNDDEFEDEDLLDDEDEGTLEDLYSVPFLTVKRIFTARNSGNLPVTIRSISINGSPCEGSGYHIIDCQPFQLAPNEGRRIDIAHTPGFTISRVRSLLEFHTSMGYPVNFTLESYVPPEYLRPCYAAMPRPRWEAFLLLSSTCMMIMLLVCVTVAAFLDTDGIMQTSFFNVATLQPLLDLNLIDDSMFGSSGDDGDGEDVAKRRPAFDESSVTGAESNSVAPSVAAAAVAGPLGVGASEIASHGPHGPRGLPEGFPPDLPPALYAYTYGGAHYLRHAHAHAHTHTHTHPTLTSAPAASSPTSSSSSSSSSLSSLSSHQRQTPQSAVQHHSSSLPLPLPLPLSQSRRQRGNTPWLNWLRSLLFPGMAMLKVKSKGRTSFIAAAQAAAAQAAFSQALSLDEDGATAVQGVLLAAAATVQRGGRKKAPQGHQGPPGQPQPQEDLQGRHGRHGHGRQGKRKGGSQGAGGRGGAGGNNAGAGGPSGGGGSTGTGAGAGAGTGTGAGAGANAGASAGAGAAGTGASTGPGGGGRGGGGGSHQPRNSDNCPLHSKHAGSRRDRRNKKNIRCTCKPFGVDIHHVDDMDEQEDFSAFEDSVPADDPINEFDPDPDLDPEIKSIKTGIGDSSSELATGDRGKKTDPSCQGGQGGKGSRGGKRGKGSQNNNDIMSQSHQDQQTRKFHLIDQLGRPYANVDPEKQRQSQGQGTGRQNQQRQQQGQGSGCGQGQGRRNQNQNQQGGNSVRIDSMTVRNRSSWKQGRTGGNSGTNENKRSSISDSGESLELPYRLKPSDNSGKKSPAASTLRSGPLESSQMSLFMTYNHEPPPACPPPPSRLWETSFSEVVSRGETTYSTVARMGTKADTSRCSVNVKSSGQSSVCSIKDSVPKCSPSETTVSRKVAAAVPGGIRDEFKTPCLPHDGANTAEPKKELGPIGPRKKSSAIIAPWSENGVATVVAPPSSPPAISSIYLREGVREGLREDPSENIRDVRDGLRETFREQFEPYPTPTLNSSSSINQMKEEQYNRYQMENQATTGMNTPMAGGIPSAMVSGMPNEYPAERPSSYESSYEQYHEADGHYRGQRLSQPVGHFDASRPPLYVGPSSYNINRVMDHQMEQGMDMNVNMNLSMNGDEPCEEQHVDQNYDQAYDQPFDQSFEQPAYDQQFDPAALKHQSPQQMIGGPQQQQQHQQQLDMFVQQFQQQSIQSHPAYPQQIHQLQIQQQRQLSQNHLQQLQLYQQQQQQLAAQGQAVVLLGNQRNIIAEPGMMPYMWMDQQSAQVQQQMPIPPVQPSVQPSGLPQYAQHQFAPAPAPAPTPALSPQAQAAAQSMAQQLQQFHLQQQQLQQTQQLHQQPPQQQLRLIQEERERERERDRELEREKDRERAGSVLGEELQAMRYREGWQRQRVGSSSPWDKKSSPTPLGPLGPSGSSGSSVVVGMRPGSAPGNGTTAPSPIPVASALVGTDVVLPSRGLQALQALQSAHHSLHATHATHATHASHGRNGSVWGAVGESASARAKTPTVSANVPTPAVTPTPTPTPTATPAPTPTTTCLSSSHSSIWSSDSLMGISRPYAHERTNSTANSQSANQCQEENTFDPFRSRTISNIWSTQAK